MLTVSEIAARWDMTPAAVRARIRTGALPASRVGRGHRVAWTDVLACETGSGSPDDPRERTALLTIAAFGCAIGVSGRTVHRWIAAGLPARRIGVNIRLHPIDAGDWMADRLGWRPETADLLRRPRWS